MTKSAVGGGFLFGWLFGKENKLVKELRKNQGLTARGLAMQVKVDTIEILNVEDIKLKDVPEPLKTKISPILKGDYMDKIPW
jgi:hypothetical protein